MSPKKKLQELRATFAEMRPNAGLPAAPAQLDLVVSQSPFPWLNTVSFVAAAPAAREEERV